MVKVHVLVEGQTEETFVNRILRPHLWPLGINPQPQGLGTQGLHVGIVEYPRARKQMRITLAQDPGGFCTTMVDYYRLPDSWPGRKAAEDKPFDQKATTIEQAIRSDLSDDLGAGFDRERLIPYIQMHEFEALLFSDVSVLTERLGLSDTAKVQGIRSEFESPEEINDSVQTAPSKRIAVLDPGYQKVNDGFLIAQRIGLATMRAECPHFDEWVGKLEALASK